MNIDQLIEDVEKSIHPDKVGPYRNREAVKQAIEKYIVERLSDKVSVTRKGQTTGTPGARYDHEGI